jgi:hypothetical protein
VILKQTFKTLAGAQKRAAFETAHSKSHRYVPVRCTVDGEVDPYVMERDRDYVWRLERRAKGSRS